MYDRVSAASKGYGFVYFNSKEAQQLACLPPFNYQILEGILSFSLPFLLFHSDIYFLNEFDFVFRIPSDGAANGSRYDLVHQWP